MATSIVECSHLQNYISISVDKIHGLIFVVIANNANLQLHVTLWEYWSPSLLAASMLCRMRIKYKRWININLESKVVRSFSSFMHPLTHLLERCVHDEVDKEHKPYTCPEECTASRDKQQAVRHKSLVNKIYSLQSCGTTISYVYF